MQAFLCWMSCIIAGGFVKCPQRFLVIRFSSIFAMSTRLPQTTVLDPIAVLSQKKRHIEAFLEQRKESFDRPLESINVDRIAIRIPRFLQGREDAVELCLAFGDNVDILNHEYYPSDWYRHRAYVCVRMCILARDNLTLEETTPTAFGMSHLRVMWTENIHSIRYEIKLSTIVKNLLAGLRGILYEYVEKHVWDTSETFDAMSHTEELEVDFVKQFRRMYCNRRKSQ